MKPLSTNINFMNPAKHEFQFWSENKTFTN